MAKKGNNKGRARRQRQNRQIRSRAVNDVQLMNQGSIDVLNAQLQQAQEDYLRMMQTGQSVYGGAADAIRGIEEPDFGGIASDLQGWLNGLSPELLGAPGGVDMGGGEMVGMPDAEAAAGASYGGAIGAGALSALANDQSRNAMLQQGAQREAVVGGRNVQDSLMQRMEDTLQGYNDQLRGITAQEPYQIRSRIDDLRDQAIEQRLAMSKMQGDRAFSEWLQGYVGGQVGGGGGFRSGGGGGGGGGGGTRPGGGADIGPGGGTVSHATIDNQGMSNAPADSPNWVGKARRINNIGSFTGLPEWLQRTYEQHSGPERWLSLQDDPRGRRQIFRRTRPHVQALFRHMAEPDQVNNPGRQIVRPGR